MKEDIPLLGRWVARAFQKYWRVTRGFRLSVEACVIDEAGRTLMIRDENGVSWKLPEGTVRKNENLETALRCILRDGAAIEVNGTPELVVFYSIGQSEQRGVYFVRQWRQSLAETGREMRFFPLDELPAGINPETCARIRRLVEGRTISQV